ELEFNILPTTKLDIYGMASLGNWKYNSDFEASVTDIDLNEPAADEFTLYVNGLKVGDAAQTTFSLGAGYRIFKGLRLFADYYHAANLYARYDINDSQFLSPGGEVKKLPSYGLVDAGASWNFNMAGMDMRLQFNMNNVLNTLYIAELTTNRPELYDNIGFFGFGRTWNISLKANF
ncbi:MAG TPA: TonB-dependent receptor, partial [Bacteroidales bacterium]|nr:TonB-dependent receptor [Bacteroidales bacterium]